MEQRKGRMQGGIFKIDTMPYLERVETMLLQQTKLYTNPIPIQGTFTFGCLLWIHSH